MIVSWSLTLGRSVLVLRGPDGSLLRVGSPAAIRLPRRLYTLRPSRLRAALVAAGVEGNDFRIVQASPQEMPRKLSAADAAICFVTPSFSKMASSPTKIGEYLGVGLPVVMNRGVGDSDVLIAGGGPIVDAGSMTDGELDAAAARLIELLGAPSTSIDARALATRFFDLEQIGVRRYVSLYDRMSA